MYNVINRKYIFMQIKNQIGGGFGWGEGEGWGENADNCD